MLIIYTLILAILLHQLGHLIVGHLLYPLFELQYARQRNSEIKLRNYNSFFNVIFSSFPILATIFIIYFGSQEVVNQSLSIGGLVGINILNARMFSPIFKFSILSQAIYYKEKIENTKINKNINENIDGVNPKLYQENYY